MMGNGIVGGVKFQGAKVRKPLLAVSSLNDRGNPCWFDHDSTGGSYIIPKDSPELVEIRRLIGKIKMRVRMERKGGIFQLRNWIVNKAKSSGFHRQEKA